MGAPRIDTERLVLRAFEARDFEPFAASFLDPIASRYLAKAPRTRRDAYMSFASGVGQWAITGTGWWAVELRASRAFVGTIGVFYRESALADLAEADLEVGWTTVREHWGRGYAKEAARAALDDARARLAPPRVIAYIDEGNVASIRVAESLGLRRAGRADFYGEPCGLWASR